jgi:hypothetical protein
LKGLEVKSAITPTEAMGNAKKIAMMFRPGLLPITSKTIKTKNKKCQIHAK